MVEQSTKSNDLEGLKIDPKTNVVMVDGFIYDNPFYHIYKMDEYMSYIFKHMDKIKRWFKKKADTSKLNNYEFDAFIERLQREVLDYDGIYQKLEEDVMEKWLYKVLNKTYVSYMADKGYPTLDGIRIKGSKEAVPVISSGEVEEGAKGLILDLQYRQEDIIENTSDFIVDQEQENWEELYIDLVNTFNGWLLGNADHSLIRMLNTKVFVYLYFFEVPAVVQERFMEELTLNRDKNGGYSKVLKRKMRREIAIETANFLRIQEDDVIEVMEGFYEEVSLDLADALDVLYRVEDLIELAMTSYWMPKEVEQFLEKRVK